MAADRHDQCDLEALSLLENYRRWIVESIKPWLRAKTVEYGAGIGTISEALIPLVEEIDLIEPMEPMYRKLSARFPASDRIRIKQQTIESNVRLTADAVYDCAVLVNVLEHIEDDRAVLGELHRILKIDGSLCLFVPALMWLYSNYDRSVGHYRRYELQGLRQLVSEAGFEVVNAIYFDILGIVPWFVNFRMLGRMGIQGPLAQAYDTVAVPFGRRLESLVRPPIGKNILLVARRT